jgi:hypothetical protein
MLISSTTSSYPTISFFLSRNLWVLIILKQLDWVSTSGDIWCFLRSRNKLFAAVWIFSTRKKKASSLNSFTISWKEKISTRHWCTSQWFMSRQFPLAKVTTLCFRFSVKWDLKVTGIFSTIFSGRITTISCTIRRAVRRLSGGWWWHY